MQLRAIFFFRDILGVNHQTVSLLLCKLGRTLAEALIVGAMGRIRKATDGRSTSHSSFIHIEITAVRCLNS